MDDTAATEAAKTLAGLDTLLEGRVDAAFEALAGTEVRATLTYFSNTPEVIRLRITDVSRDVLYCTPVDDTRITRVKITRSPRTSQFDWVYMCPKGKRSWTSPRPSTVTIG